MSISQSQHIRSIFSIKNGKCLTLPQFKKLELKWKKIAPQLPAPAKLGENIQKGKRKRGTKLEKKISLPIGSSICFWTL